MRIARKINVCLALVLLLLPGTIAGQEDRTVMVDGLSIHVWLEGLEARGPEEPVVVLESGAVTGLETWSPVLLELAGIAPVVAYDRSGIGGSEWDGLPPTPERVTTLLRQVLAELNVPPPYILVGHSWGGALIHHFGATYATEVFGMVYIDPTDFTWTPEDELAALATVGMDSMYYEGRRGQRNQVVSGFAPRVRAEREVFHELADQWGDSRAHLPAPDVPTSVVIAAQPPVRAGISVPFDAQAYANLKFELRVERLSAWARRGGSFVVAGTPERNVHRSEPELVIEAIRRILQAVRQPLGTGAQEPGEVRESIAACATIEGALERRACLSDAHRRLGEALRVSGDLEGAIAEIREVLLLDPDNAATHTYLGGILLGDGDLRGAIAESREALRLDPGSVGARGVWATALYRSGDLRGAIRVYRVAVQLAPDNAVARTNFGAMLYSNGDLEGAIAEYREALRVDPDYANAHGNLGTALASSGDLDSAIAEYREALRVEAGDPGMMNSLARLLVRRGLELDEALALSRRTVEAEPENPNFWDTLAEVYLQRGQLDEATQANETGQRYATGNARLLRSLEDRAQRITEKRGAS